MKVKRRLLIPAALAVGGVTAGASCTPAQPVCGSEQYHVCWPDGGFACPAECGGIKLPDGGIELDSMGQPTCLC